MTCAQQRTCALQYYAYMRRNVACTQDKTCELQMLVKMRALTGRLTVAQIRARFSCGLQTFCAGTDYRGCFTGAWNTAAMAGLYVIWPVCAGILVGSCCCLLWQPAPAARKDLRVRYRSCHAD